MIGMLYLLAANWEKLPVRPRPSRWKYPGAPEPWNVRTGLPIMAGMGVLAYVSMTIAIHLEKLIQVPEELKRQAPQMRQMAFSLGITLKGVLMLVTLYLVWALINAAQGQFVGFERRYLTGLVLVVLVPLAVYGTRMFRTRP